MRYTLFPLIFFQLMLVFPTTCQAEKYELGQGWDIDKYHLSGYANIEVVDRFGAPAKLEVDDLSLFANGRVNRWVNPFLEVELSKQTLIRQGGGRVNGDIIIERFYNDTELSENDIFRVGKILSPLGDWNLMHAAPLIPIITRPYTTARGFGAYSSGISWIHNVGESVISDFQLYWQPDEEWFRRPKSLAPRSFRNLFGGHVNMPLSLIDKVGASFQSGQLVETGETFNLFGFNADKSFGRLKLESELIMAHFSGMVLPGAATRFHDRESGIFWLADYSFTPKFHGILEWERYQDHTMIMPSRSTLLAFAYRPSIPVVWKLEYIHQAGESASFSTIKTGWKAALAVMF